MLTIKQALDWAKSQLIPMPLLPSAIDFDINLMLAHVLGVSTTWLRIWPEQSLTALQKLEFEQLCRRRMAGEPIAYLLGECPFWTFKLNVTSNTLIPRPETEHLVEWVLQHFTAEQRLTIADLGTGSGAIALALALERPQWRIIATDYSEAVLAIAESNAKQLHIDNIEWYCGSWFEALPVSLHFHLIVSNPPYIAAHDPHLLHDGLLFEPTAALVAPDHGLAHLKHLVNHAHNYLTPHGWLALEHGFEQGSVVRQLLQKKGFTSIATINDYSSHERVTFGQKQNERYNSSAP